jgi:hypothetical protein
MPYLQGGGFSIEKDPRHLQGGCCNVEPRNRHYGGYPSVLCAADINTSPDHLFSQECSMRKKTIVILL